MSRSNEQLGRQMGKSFADVLQEEKFPPKSLKQIEEELCKLSDLFKGSVQQFFDNPLFDQSEKKQVFDQISKDLKLSKETSRFMEVAIRQHLVRYLLEISETFSEKLRAHRNEVYASVTTAFKLTTKDQEKITTALGKAMGKNITCDVTVDPNLIGGVVAKIGGVVFDASIAGYLERMQEELIK